MASGEASVQSWRSVRSTGAGQALPESRAASGSAPGAWP